MEKERAPMRIWSEVTQSDGNAIVIRGWGTPYMGEIPKPTIRKPGFPVLGTLMTLIGADLVYYGIEAILSGNSETVAEGACLVLPFGLIAAGFGVACFKDWYDDYVRYAASKKYAAGRDS